MNNIKIIFSMIILTIIISMLFLVIPITNTFIISYIFTLIAIIGIAVSLCTVEKTKLTKAPQGHAFIYTAIAYAIVSVIFSVISYILKFSTLWVVTIHIGILGICSIRAIAISIGSEYINKINKINEEKHTKFSNEKKDYWR